MTTITQRCNITLLALNAVAAKLSTRDMLIVHVTTQFSIAVISFIFPCVFLTSLSYSVLFQLNGVRLFRDMFGP
jgi:hypothetical protein